MVAFTVANRGTMRTLVHAPDNTPVTIQFDAIVNKAPAETNGKNYATLVMDPGSSFPDVVKEADVEIRKRQTPLAYSPLLANGKLLVIKIAKTALMDKDGVQDGDTVTVRMKLGNFSLHGYCWVASHFFKP
jgi:hypothetical protein